jgi:two-component system, chemotaxis family, CheB/CheR fusion protein
MPRVLVVDDCPETASSFCELLRLLGHEARAVNDGPSALALAAGFRPEAALVDIVMPGMDGYEVAHHLRAVPGLEHALLIAISGEVEGSGRRPPEGDFDLYLLKPVDPDDLAHILSDCHGVGAP